MSLNTTLICVSFCTKLFRKMKDTFLSNLKNKTRKELTKIEIRRRFRYCYIPHLNDNKSFDEIYDKSKYWCKCNFCNEVFQFNTANIWRGDFHQGCKLQKRDKMLMYDDKLLQSIVKSHSVRLTYTGNLNRETKMTGNCIVQNCSNTFTRNFREIYNNNSPKLTCKGCTKIEGTKLRKSTFLHLHGVESSFNVDSFKLKQQKTIMKNYGVSNISQNQAIKEKKVETCIQNYGVANPSQCQELQQKKVETSLAKYGVEHSMQNAEIAEKCAKNAFKLKTYTFNSGETCRVQGYEPLALDLLENKHGISSQDIITTRLKVPEIWYMDTSTFTHRRYFVDIYIPIQNKMIEVKSTWTYEKDIAKIEWKKNACKLYGYKFEVWVFDYKGNLIHSE